MQTWIALFRGINVGGNNILPMASLVEDLESLNFKDVRTYIQSGNAVFKSKSKSPTAMAKKIATRIDLQHGFCPHVFVLSEAKLKTAIENNPFPEATSDPKTLHFFFLASIASTPNMEAIDLACTETERYSLVDDVFYLEARIGRSKLASNVEKHLGVATTARNYRTVEKILALVANP